MSKEAEPQLHTSSEVRPSNPAVSNILRGIHHSFRRPRALEVALYSVPVLAGAANCYLSKQLASSDLAERRAALGTMLIVTGVWGLALRLRNLKP